MNAGTLQAVSNREDWVDGGDVRDADGVLVDIAGASIILQVNDRESHAPLLTVSTDNGLITITGTGTFEWEVPVASMRVFCAETYDVGITIELNGSTTQLFKGTIPILDGVVT
jgi:hypothetical protein